MSPAINSVIISAIVLVTPINSAIVLVINSASNLAINSPTIRATPGAAARGYVARKSRWAPKLTQARANKGSEDPAGGAAGGQRALVRGQKIPLGVPRAVNALC